MYTETTFPVIDLAGTGRSIELHRRQAGLTVRDLQTYFGFEYPQAIYKWQHGECLPTVDNLLALARLLRVSMEDLLVYQDQEVPDQPQSHAAEKADAKHKTPGQGLFFCLFALQRAKTPAFRKTGDCRWTDPTPADVCRGRVLFWFLIAGPCG